MVWGLNDDGQPAVVETLHDGVGPEPLEHLGIPTVRSHHQVAVCLKVRRESANRLPQSQLLGQVIANGCETRPHLDLRRVTARLLGRAFDRAHAARERLIGEEGVQHDLVERTATERQRVRPERYEPQRNVR